MWAPNKKCSASVQSRACSVVLETETVQRTVTETNTRDSTKQNTGDQTSAWLTIIKMLLSRCQLKTKEYFQKFNNYWRRKPAIIYFQADEELR